MNTGHQDDHKDSWEERLRAKSRRVLGTFRRKWEDFEHDPRVEENLSKAQGKMDEWKERVDRGDVRRSLEEAGVEAREKISQAARTARDRVEEAAEREVVGRYATVNILAPDDTMILARGEMITYAALERARDAGVLDRVLAHNSRKPIE